MSKKIGHLKVAVCSKNLTHVDSAFSFSRQVVFYDVSYDSIEFIDVARFASPPRRSEAAAAAPKQPNGTGKKGGCCMAEIGGSEVDQLSMRVASLEGCDVMFCVGLNDLAAVRIRDAGVFPVKMEASREIDEVLSSLQWRMNHNPPLWIRRLLGYGNKNSEYRVAVGAA
ncbi:MAG: NifB/NifX family molybdenum-iron cluster-binding protein [Tolumonas sp.]|nr:NifB/NifX family molybdenum-iron cluster-binding protein [Tolumonas sp.]